MNWVFGAGSAASRPADRASGATTRIEKEITRRRLFMAPHSVTPSGAAPIRGLLLFFFVLCLEDGGGGYGVVTVEFEQANTLGGAAGFADFVGVNPDDFT